MVTAREISELTAQEQRQMSRFIRDLSQQIATRRRLKKLGRIRRQREAGMPEDLYAYDQ